MLPKQQGNFYKKMDLNIFKKILSHFMLNLKILLRNSTHFIIFHGGK